MHVLRDCLDRELHTLDSSQDLHKEISMRITRRESDCWDPVWPDELARDRQEVSSNRLKRSMAVGVRDAQTLEPVEQIVRESYQVEEDDIGWPRVGRDFAEGIGFLELTGDELGIGSVIVKAPQMVGCQRQIGDEYLIVVALYMEERELPRRIFRLETANDDEPLLRFPSRRLIGELGG